MDKTHLAWLAGFWDGEGSTGFASNKKTKILVLQLSHTELESVKRVLAILKYFGIHGRGYTYQERDPEKHRDAHYLRISGMRNALKIAKLLLPYAVTKKRHWEIAAIWCRSRIRRLGIDINGQVKRGGRALDRVYLPSEMKLFDEMRKLNRRGPEDRRSRKKASEGRFSL